LSDQDTWKSLTAREVEKTTGFSASTIWDGLGVRGSWRVSNQSSLPDSLELLFYNSHLCSLSNSDINWQLGLSFLEGVYTFLSHFFTGWVHIPAQIVICTIPEGSYGLPVIGMMPPTVVQYTAFSSSTTWAIAHSLCVAHSLSLLYIASFVSSHSFSHSTNISRSPSNC
jgi:hypothetical protein